MSTGELHERVYAPHTFVARLREQVDLDAFSAELLAVVDQTVAPTRASLWLCPSASSRPPT